MSVGQGSSRSFSNPTRAGIWLSCGRSQMVSSTEKTRGSPIGRTMQAQQPDAGLHADRRHGFPRHRHPGQPGRQSPEDGHPGLPHGYGHRLSAGCPLKLSCCQQKPDRICNSASGTTRKKCNMANDCARQVCALILRFFQHVGVRSICCGSGLNGCTICIAGGSGLEPGFQTDAMRKIAVSKTYAVRKLGEESAHRFLGLLRDMVDAADFSEVPILPDRISVGSRVLLEYAVGPTVVLEVEPRMKDVARQADWSRAHRFCLMRILDGNRVLS